MRNKPLLSVRGLKKWYPLRREFFGRPRGEIKAVDDVSFELQPGETLGLVGESGCGKTTLGRTLLQLVQPTSGEVMFRLPDGEVINLAATGGAALRALRPHMQMIFQDPMSSLDPRMTILELITEPLVIAGGLGRAQIEQRATELIRAVGLEVKHLHRYPHAFSGGQRQRVGIARALATNPSLIVADEAVSALDVSVQAQILNLLIGLQRERNLAFLFISHDLGVIKHVSDRVIVMYLGRMVEQAGTDDLFYRPRHPYTAALLASVPQPDPRQRKRTVPLQGEVPNPVAPPPGCHFHPRCPFAQDICRTEYPALRPAGSAMVACHFAEELMLEGTSDKRAAGE